MLQQNTVSVTGHSVTGTGKSWKLNIWFSPAAIEGWLAKNCKKQGRSRIYSDEAILRYGKSRWGITKEL
jgi:hypothetical protein